MEIGWVITHLAFCVQYYGISFSRTTDMITEVQEGFLFRDVFGHWAIAVLLANRAA